MIRQATIADLPQLMRLAAEMHGESRFALRFPFDEGKVATLFTAAIKGAEFFCWVVDKDGVLVGGLLACVTEQWFSRAKVAQDFGLFLHPEHRGGLYAVRLLQRYRMWAHEQGATDTEMGVNTGVDPVRTGKLLQCLGYRQVGQLYSMKD